MHHQGVLLRASEILRRIQLSGQELLNDWPYEMVALHTEVTIFRVRFAASTHVISLLTTPQKLHDWAELLGSIREQTGDLQELLELQAIASELQTHFVELLQTRLSNGES